jgi:hypothetical protein
MVDIEEKISTLEEKVAEYEGLLRDAKTDDFKLKYGYLLLETIKKVNTHHIIKQKQEQQEGKVIVLRCCAMLLCVFEHLVLIVSLIFSNNENSLATR